MKSMWFYHAKTYSTRILGHYLARALPDSILDDRDCQAELREMLTYFDNLEERVAKLEALLVASSKAPVESQ